MVFDCVWMQEEVCLHERTMDQKILDTVIVETGLLTYVDRVHFMMM